MSRFNHDMMTLAREFKGMTQTALARLTGINQTTISRYESGLLLPPDGHLDKLAACLERPRGFFYLGERMYNASSMFHRKRKSLTLTDEKKIHAQVNDLRIRAAILLHEAEIGSRFSFHRLTMGEDGPEKVAQQLRQLWQLPNGPIRSVVGSIERAGGIVFRCEFGTDKLDGVSQWPLDDDHVPPVFFVRDDAPGDRQRFTLAHELGHVVMHHLPTDDPEDEADRFASEFLMPAREIGPELSRMTLQKAAAMKCYWKVSMASLIRRAFDLGKLTERQYKYFNVEMSKRGYKKCEPAIIPAEEPALFREVLRVHREGHRRNIPQLSEMLGMFEHQFKEQYWKDNLNFQIAG